MAERRPIVIVGGKQQEFAHGDTLPVDMLPELAIGDEAEWTPTFIPDGITYTIPTDTQLLTVAPVKVDGTVIIDGTLVLVGGSTVVDEGDGGGSGEVVLVGDVFGAGVGVVGTTLADVNPNVGTFGDATHVAVPTVDSKGRIVAITTVLITGTGDGGGEGSARTNVAVTTPSLAPNVPSAATPITMATAYRVLSLSTSRPARVRLYATVAQQVADLNRPVGVDPLANSGLMLDFVTLGTQSRSLNPLVDGANYEEIPSATIPMTVTNLTLTAGTVQVTLGYLRTEQ